ncbi:MAG: hypothetical protein KGY56_14245 [Desulfobacterales bacterium]|nr:hypothetical protein [Desulfobacterales bacterium]
MTQPVENQTGMIPKAADGPGKKVALDLAARKAGVIIHGRNPRKGPVKKTFYG